MKWKIFEKILQSDKMFKSNIILPHVDAVLALFQLLDRLPHEPEVYFLEVKTY